MGHEVGRPVLRVWALPGIGGYPPLQLLRAVPTVLGQQKQMVTWFLQCFALLAWEDHCGYVAFYCLPDSPLAVLCLILSSTCQH